MKEFKLLREIVFSSWFLAIIPFIAIISFLPPVDSEYDLRIESFSEPFIPFAFRDLNSDGVSEIIYTGWGEPYQYIAVKDINEGYLEQWNLADSFNIQKDELSFGDFDHDQYEEVYAFSYNQDSLFLNVKEIFDSSGINIERYFISNSVSVKGLITPAMRVCGFFDVTGDGYDELYFLIVTGFGLQPRRLYYFDLVNRSLVMGPFMGVNIFHEKMEDADADGKPEIFGIINASGNYKTPVPYSDNSAWLMVFNEYLNFEFPPLEYPGFANSVRVSSFKSKDGPGYFVALAVDGINRKGLNSMIMIISPEGKILRKRLVNEISKMKHLRTFVSKGTDSDKIIVLQDKLYELDENLEVINEVEIPFNKQNKLVNSYQVDINTDGQDEFLLYSNLEGKIVVYSSGFKKLGEHIFNAPDADLRFSNYYNSANEHKFYIYSGGNGYFLELNERKYYLFALLVYPGIYLLVLSFIIILKRINTYQIVQREKLNHRLLTLQLQGIKAQLDPHFTYNALNSIASVLYHDDRKKAYDYMNKFTLLMRVMLNDADRIYRSLGEELKFVSTYLELESLRFGERFKFIIDIDVAVDLSNQVPKLVLQTFVENAIKHGLMPCHEGGVLLIKVIKENEYLKLTIEDNGIGRIKAAEIVSSTGIGLKLTEEFYQILNQINKKQIKHVLTDLYNQEGKAVGTRVEVWVPVHESD